MPTFRGLTVSIVDSYGDALQEYGGRQLTRAATASCYIQSKSDMAFRIQVKPQIPFPTAKLNREMATRARTRRKGEGEGEKPAGGGGRNWSSREDHVKSFFSGIGKNEGKTSSQYRAPGDRRRDDEGEFRARVRRDREREEKELQQSRELDRQRHEQELGYYYKHGHVERNGKKDYRHPGVLGGGYGSGNNNSSGYHSRSSHGSRHRSYYPPDPPQPDWHILASIFLDGRKVPERSCIIYTDPNHPEFRVEEDGQCTVSHRWVQQTDGSIVQHAWVFREVGIESLLDKLLLNGSDDVGVDSAFAAKDEEELIAALGGAGIEDKEETKQLGQITVTMRRVTVKTPFETNFFEPLWRQEDRDDVDMRDLGGVTHTSTLRPEKNGDGKAKRGQVKVVTYNVLDEYEDDLATFKFYYRGEDVLRKLQFKEFQSSAPQRPPRSRNAFSSKTPLSWTNTSLTTVKKPKDLNKLKIQAVPGIDVTDAPTLKFTTQRAAVVGPANAADSVSEEGDSEHETGTSKTNSEIAPVHKMHFSGGSLAQALTRARHNNNNNTNSNARRRNSDCDADDEDQVGKILDSAAFGGTAPNVVDPVVRKELYKGLPVNFQTLDIKNTNKNGRDRKLERRREKNQEKHKKAQENHKMAQEKKKMAQEKHKHKKAQEKKKKARFPHVVFDRDRKTGGLSPPPSSRYGRKPKPAPTAVMINAVTSTNTAAAAAATAALNSTPYTSWRLDAAAAKDGDDADDEAAHLGLFGGCASSLAEAARKRDEEEEQEQGERFEGYGEDDGGDARDEDDEGMARVLELVMTFRKRGREGWEDVEEADVPRNIVSGRSIVANALVRRRGEAEGKDMLVRDDVDADADADAVVGVPAAASSRAFDFGALGAAGDGPDERCKRLKKDHGLHKTGRAPARHSDPVARAREVVDLTGDDDVSTEHKSDPVAPLSEL